MVVRLHRGRAVSEDPRSGRCRRCVPRIAGFGDVETAHRELVPPAKSLVMFPGPPGGTRAAAKRTRGLGRSPTGCWNDFQRLRAR